MGGCGGTFGVFARVRLRAQIGAFISHCYCFVLFCFRSVGPFFSFGFGAGFRDRDILVSGLCVCVRVASCACFVACASGGQRRAGRF